MPKNKIKLIVYSILIAALFLNVGKACAFLQMSADGGGADSGNVEPAKSSVTSSVDSKTGNVTTTNATTFDNGQTISTSVTRNTSGTIINKRISTVQWKDPTTRAKTTFDADADLTYTSGSAESAPTNTPGADSNPTTITQKTAAYTSDDDGTGGTLVGQATQTVYGQVVGGPSTAGATNFKGSIVISNGSMTMNYGTVYTDPKTGKQTSDTDSAIYKANGSIFLFSQNGTGGTAINYETRNVSNWTGGTDLGSSSYGGTSETIGGGHMFFYPSDNNIVPPSSIIIITPPPCPNPPCDILPKTVTVDDGKSAPIEDVCKTNPSDPSCLSFCDTHPSDPSCLSFCETHPSDSSCGSICKTNPSDPSCLPFCDTHPSNSICLSFCESHPSDPSCIVTPFCKTNPSDPSCGGSSVCSISNADITPNNKMVYVGSKLSITWESIGCDTCRLSCTDASKCGIDTAQTYTANGTLDAKPQAGFYAYKITCTGSGPNNISEKVLSNGAYDQCSSSQPDNCLRIRRPFIFETSAFLNALIGKR